MEYITQSAAETQRIGKKIADSLVKGIEKRKVIALSGDLGSGKTTFTQGFCKELGIKDRVISPTFILLRNYDIPGRVNKFKYLYHIDLYRLEHNFETELENIGVFDYIKEENSIVVIEWAEKVKKILKEDVVWIKFEYMDDNKRRISID